MNPVLIETSWNVKPSILKGDVQDNSVLIETSWNVKQSAKTTLKPKYQSINRNIVECKDHLRILRANLVSVLIETSWNVKKYIQCSQFYQRTVLIETSWNVKNGLMDSTGQAHQY